MARWLRDEPSAIALSGDWFDGGVVLLSHPAIAADPGADLVGRLAQVPVAPADEVGGAGDAATTVIGGGWFGWLGFGLADAIESLPAAPRRPERLARGHLAFYDHLVRRDRSGVWWFEALWTEPRARVLGDRRELWRARLSAPLPPRRGYDAGPLTIAPSRLAGHHAAVAQTVERIRAGELAQANICLELEGRIDGDPLDLWIGLANEARAARAAYVAAPSPGGHAVISISPELFLSRHGRQVEARPIKGTSPRSRPSEELLESEKDRAENVMIVDLMRNDLGRVCEFGTVAVTELCGLRPAAGVWHLESTISGRLRQEVNDGDLLRATFPPGSVTGAPKVQALRVIRALEPTPREAYCGAIGGVSSLAGLELSVAIRTLECSGGRLWLGAGGGITAGSDPDAETAEALLKASGVAAAAGIALAPGLTGLDALRPDTGRGVIETLLVVDREPVEVDAHLRRLAASAAAFGWEVPADLSIQVRAAAGDVMSSRAALRITLDESGTRIEARSPPTARPVELVPILVPGGLGAHKWADRRLVDAYAGSDRAALILDSDQTVLEAGHAAVLLVRGGEILVPPLDGRILPSLSRHRALSAAVDNGVTIHTAPFTLADARAADAVLLTSSLRGVHPGRLPGGPESAGSGTAWMFAGE